MQTAIEQFLWRPAQPFYPGHDLRVRIGHGRATYHRFEPDKRRHTINLGLKMIHAKQQPAHCGAWLSAREILARRYFGGEVSEANLLAHTCCHEFAHLLQSARGERHYGSVHNRAFYDQLDRLHRPPHALELRQWLVEQGQRQGLMLATQAITLATASQPSPAADFRKGERVYFWYGQTRHTGRVIRVNRRSCSVLGIGVSEGLRFRVPPQLLHSFDRR